VTIDEDPQARVSLLPRFRQPPNPPPPEASPTPAPAGANPHPSQPGRLYRPDESARPEPTRTETSSDGDVHKPTPGEAAALAIGVMGIVFAGAAFVVRWRTRRRLREPSKQQLTDIASPLGRILLRHADLGWLSADISDGLKSAAATGAYLNDGPLLLAGDDIDPGIPPNLQEEQL